MKKTNQIVYVIVVIELHQHIKSPAGSIDGFATVLFSLDIVASLNEVDQMHLNNNEINLNTPLLLLLLLLQYKCSTETVSIVYCLLSVVWIWLITREQKSLISLVCPYEYNHHLLVYSYVNDKI